MNKIVVFDLFETLIHTYIYDFNRGLKYIYDHVINENVTYEELCEYSLKIWKPRYDLRDLDYHELNFRDELLDFQKVFGFRQACDIDELLYQIIKSMNDVDLFEDTVRVLQTLKQRQVPVYILSNAIFDGKTMTRFLENLNLPIIFEKMYFSCDYQIRKPNQAFYQIIFQDIQQKYPNIDKKQIYFVGDNYQADIEGSYQFGFTPIFLNRSCKQIDNHLKVTQVSSLDLIIDKLIVDKG